jgi:hypothetical protein
MEAIIIPKDQFQELLSKVDQIHLQVSSLNKKPDDVLIDNPEFIAYMHISKRTAQTWRDEKRIPFTQIGAKIYYKLADVMKLIEHYTRQPDIQSSRK